MTIRIVCLEPEAALETAREAGVPAGLEATDETLAAGTLSPGTWARCAEHLAPNPCIELVTAIGA